LAALEGRSEEAAAFADQVGVMAAENEWALMSLQAAFAKGRAAWLSGDASSGVRLLDVAIEQLLLPGGFGGTTMGLTWLAEAQLDSQDVEGAAATIARAEHIIVDTDEHFFEGALRRVKSRVLRATGLVDEAADELDLAIAVARAQGNVALETAANRSLAPGRSET
jgi:hypothetical protein